MCCNSGKQQSGQKIRFEPIYTLGPYSANYSGVVEYLFYLISLHIDKRGEDSAGGKKLGKRGIILQYFQMVYDVLLGAGGDGLILERPR